MRRSDDNAIGKSVSAASVVANDGVRNNRSRRVTKSALVSNLNTVGGKDFNRGSEGWLRQSVGVFAQKQRPGNVVLFAELTNRLADRGYVVIVESVVLGAPSMSGRSKSNQLVWLRWVWAIRVVVRHQTWDVFE